MAPGEQLGDVFLADEALHELHHLQVTNPFNSRVLLQVWVFLGKENALAIKVLVYLVARLFFDNHDAPAANCDMLAVSPTTCAPMDASLHCGAVAYILPADQARLDEQGTKQWCVKALPDCCHVKLISILTFKANKQIKQVSTNYLNSMAVQQGYVHVRVGKLALWRIATLALATTNAQQIPLNDP